LGAGEKEKHPWAMNSGQAWRQNDKMARPGSNGVFFFLKERKRNK
jgi:hypothetical protein